MSKQKEHDDDQREALALERLEGGVASFSLDMSPWQVTCEWPTGADQGGPWRLVIEPTAYAHAEDVAGGLSSTVMRRIDFQAFSQLWREGGREALELYVDTLNQQLTETLRNLAAQGITDEYLAHLSKAYVALVQNGERSIASKLAEMTGKSPDTIKQHLKRARKEEMLTTVSGKAGGRLTDKAADLIGVNRRRNLGEKENSRG